MHAFFFNLGYLMDSYCSAICPQRPVSCPQGCLLVMPYSRVAAHIANECPATVVPCPNGCTVAPPLPPVSAGTGTTPSMPAVDDAIEELDEAAERGEDPASPPASASVASEAYSRNATAAAVASSAAAAVVTTAAAASRSTAVAPLTPLLLRRSDVARHCAVECPLTTVRCAERDFAWDAVREELVAAPADALAADQWAAFSASTGTSVDDDSSSAEHEAEDGSTLGCRRSGQKPAGAAGSCRTGRQVQHGGSGGDGDDGEYAVGDATTESAASDETREPEEERGDAKEPKKVNEEGAARRTEDGMLGVGNDRGPPHARRCPVRLARRDMPGHAASCPLRVVCAATQRNGWDGRRRERPLTSGRLHPSCSTPLPHQGFSLYCFAIFFLCTSSRLLRATHLPLPPPPLPVSFPSTSFTPASLPTSPLLQLACHHLGCSARMSAYRLPAHEQACALRPTRCPNGCGAELALGTLAAHRRDECPLERIACPMAKYGCTSDLMLRSRDPHAR